MGRMHSCGKGISASALLHKRTPPSWLKISSQDENTCKFAKKGLTLSQIGVIPRDSYGIAQVRSATGSNILRILKAHGSTWEERKDKDSKFRLILVESRIHRLARYYKRPRSLVLSGNTGLPRFTLVA